MPWSITPLMVNVIIPKYLQHGFYFPNMLDGEFAICLVDYANRTYCSYRQMSLPPNLFGMPSDGW